MAEAHLKGTPMRSKRITPRKLEKAMRRSGIPLIRGAYINTKEVEVWQGGEREEILCVTGLCPISQVAAYEAGLNFPHTEGGVTPYNDALRRLKVTGGYDRIYLDTFWQMYDSHTRGTGSPPYTQAGRDAYACAQLYLIQEGVLVFATDRED